VAVLPEVVEKCGPNFVCRRHRLSIAWSLPLGPQATGAGIPLPENP